jgi:hypothetical protein
VLFLVFLTFFAYFKIPHQDSFKKADTTTRLEIPAGYQPHDSPQQGMIENGASNKTGHQEGNTRAM